MLRISRFSYLFYLAAVFCLGVKSFAGGVIGTGGGTEYRIDFVQNARQWIYPWLKENGHKLEPKIDADQFLKTVDPDRINTVEHVFESCDPGGKDKDPQLRGVEVQACYNADTDLIYLSQTLYPINAKPTRTELSLISHEVFRRMSILVDPRYADNKLQLTSQMSFKGVSDDRKPLITPEYKGHLTRYCDLKLKITRNCLVDPHPYPFEL